mmetsp:Transcript_960/g.1738  ORF Transcript_960/g.1738 Transcript_960/m.1738 type:complete len:247 (-) Transcript_960:692-1432(-)
MRRGPGIAGLQQQRQQHEKFQAAGEALAAAQLAAIRDQLNVFKTNLEEFARKHKNEINKNPAFRAQFHQMCAAVGVDPLASNKGFWAQLLGVGDFYYELGVQIIEICLATRSANGGLLDIRDLCKMLSSKNKARSSQQITQDDVEHAIKKLKVLGKGFDILTLGSSNTKLVQSVPSELNNDHTALLVLAQGGGYCTLSMAVAQLQWKEQRAQLVLSFLQKEGMAWIDLQADEPQYWFPCLFDASLQ